MIKTTAFCGLPFEKMKISCEGNVSMCCFQERGCLGNILHTSLEEMWNGELANDIRRTTAAGQLHQKCQITSCPFFYVKNPPAFPVKRFKFPVDIELDLPSQHCNIGGENPTPEAPACLMCERHLYWYPQDDRLKEVCGRLLPYMQYVRSLHLQGIAESFWKDRIFEIFQWLGLHPGNGKVTVSTTTNGTILTEPRRRRFLKYPRSVLTFSIDAATPETYKLIRRVDLFHRVTENLLAYSRERNPNGQYLRIHNNINLLNVKEVVGMVELAAKANCPIDFNPTYAAPSICVSKWNASIFKNAEKEIIEAAAALNVQVTFMRNLTLDFDPKGEPPEGIIISSDELTQSAAVLGIPAKELKRVSPPQIDFRLPLL